MFSFVGLCFGMVVRLFRSCFAATTRRGEASTSSPKSRAFRQAFLGNRSAGLVSLETAPHHRHARNRGPLAPDWFSMYWRLISRVRTQVGRRPTSKEVRELIPRMVVENPSWGAPRIHGELRMLGFELSERSRPRQVPMLTSYMADMRKKGFLRYFELTPAHFQPQLACLDVLSSIPNHTERRQRPR